MLGCEVRELHVARPRVRLRTDIFLSIHRLIRVIRPYPSRNVEDSRIETELAALGDAIEKEEGWLFPSEPQTGVKGFMGTGPVFLIGDQPSTSEWPASNPHRRLFYDTIAGLGLTNAHITDVYKRRGKPGALRKGLPADFARHLDLLREELRILQPMRVVPMGALAHELVWSHLPEARPLVRNARHFAAIAWCASDKREQWRAEYVEELRRATIPSPVV